MKNALSRRCRRLWINWTAVEDEVVLDFTSVRRISSSAIRGMEDFASTAENKGVRVVLCGVNVGIYKVLKLVNLAPRFSFVS